jgi:hypothetical protein
MLFIKIIDKLSLFTLRSVTSADNLGKVLTILGKVLTLFLITLNVLLYKPYIKYVKKCFNKVLTTPLWVVS